MYIATTILIIILCGIAIKLLVDDMAKRLCEIVYDDFEDEPSNKISKQVKCKWCNNENVDKGCKCHNCGEIVE